jgi:hypothetical protein
MSSPIRRGIDREPLDVQSPHDTKRVDCGALGEGSLPKQRRFQVFEIPPTNAGLTRIHL